MAARNASRFRARWRAANGAPVAVMFDVVHPGIALPPPERLVADLNRGRERYNIYCTPCHDYSGTGRGMIVQRGFPQPPSYHIQRLRDAPAGHFFEVMTNGFGAMYSYAARVEPADRWRIAAYIRVLQLSRNATIQDVPEADRQKLTQQSAGQASGQSMGQSQ